MTLSMISSEEEQTAKDLIENLLGFPAPTVCGYRLAVKLHIKDERANKDDPTSKIVLPQSHLMDEMYRTVTGLVIAIGPDAYCGDRFSNSGPWCKVGDWVVIARNEGVQVQYRGVAMHYINDDRILGVVEDPDHVTKV